jgi:hypothetical protein
MAFQEFVEARPADDALAISPRQPLLPYPQFVGPSRTHHRYRAPPVKRVAPTLAKLSSIACAAPPCF